jgi:proline iminopeptidase
MAWFEIGEGPTVICLHGSYDHLLYRPMGELLARKYRCVLYDQRGSGESTLTDLNDEAMDIANFTRDLDALRRHLKLDKVAILGHSWGCALGLLYAQEFPDRVSRLILIGPGPLNTDMKDYYRANRDRMAYPVIPGELARLDDQLQKAKMDKAAFPQDIDELLIRAWAPVMFYSSEQAADFVDSYLESGGHQRHAVPASNFSIDMQLRASERITAPTLVVYGYQDYEPITQAYLIQERIPRTQISFLNRCGHMVWLDQPEDFFAAIDSFLADKSGAG